MFKLLIICPLIYYSVAETRSHRVRRIVGGIAAEPPPEDDPVVFTRFAGKTAIVTGTRQYPHYVFRGIGYAHPPLGTDRFVRPREKFLEGKINATKYPSPCLQPVPGQNFVIGSEDCLYLNIFTPTLPSGVEGLPVVVWIHGGGFRYGSASQYGVQHLVGKQLVVVTIQYRLGSLGFLSSGTKELPGNAALWDMALATQWVRNYIGFFGGNPNRIVVMGHGTGASSTLLVALSNIAKGISGVVAMSGSAVSHWATDHTPQNTALQVANENGCPTGSILIMVKCLQNVSPENLIRIDSKIEFSRLQSRGFVSGLNGQLSAAPVSEGYHDGRSLPPLVRDKPINDLYNKRNPNIPLLTGITKHETKRAVHGQYKDEIINKLRTVPNFLNKDLIQHLRERIVHSNNSHKNSPLGNLGNNLLNFGKYLEVKKNDLFDGLSKISDVTSDALFNVPAFLTAGLWAERGSRTYLYSFEHIGRARKGHHFLKGIPLVGNTSDVTSNDTVCHGDDLGYLFEANDLYGEPIKMEEELSEDDVKVREVFTQMIADFARHGKVLIDNKEAPIFSPKTNKFIQIRPKPKVGSDFKFCEMALWCNIAERLQSTTCQFLKALDTTLREVGHIVDTLNSGNLGGLLQPVGSMKQVQGVTHQKSMGKVEETIEKNAEKVINNLNIFGSGGFLG